jgi:hypothetical protein
MHATRSPITNANQAEVIPRLEFIQTLASRQLLGLDAVSEQVAWEAVLTTLRVVLEVLS